MTSQLPETSKESLAIENLVQDPHHLLFVGKHLVAHKTH
ncbi:hypothetical protein SynRS9915_00199 [Synechococcus sp. RS9915]|nr:hypothetical protein SynRS9915_00199 [Synechococcus sp. RS9915]